jgi:low affinity Fe/Cu permease
MIEHTDNDHDVVIKKREPPIKWRFFCILRYRMFNKFAIRVTQITGSPIGFLVALIIILLWAISGPFFHFSEVWQLVINTGTTIIPFLMVFVIQNSQNRDTLALHLKLDELIKANEKARNEVVGAEVKTEEEIEKLKKDI